MNRLLEAMPKMAEAVNAFTDKANRRAALHALLRVAGVPIAQPTKITAEGEPNLSVVPPLEEVLAEAEDVVEPDAGDEEPRRRRRNRKSNVRKSWARPDIDFRPEGKLSLREFYAAKAPTNFYEKNLVFVFYLEDFLPEIESIGIEHVLAAYDAVSEKAPADPENSLVATASRKKWLNTSDLKAITTSHLGREVVKHDLPIVKDKKSA